MHTFFAKYEGSRILITIPPNRRMDFANVRLWTNAPTSQGQPFQRNVYRPLDGTDALSPDGEWQVLLNACTAGAFEFFLEYEPIRDLCLIESPPSRRSANDDHPYDNPEWVKEHEQDALTDFYKSGAYSPAIALSSGSLQQPERSPAARAGPTATCRSEPVRFVCTPNLRIRGGRPGSHGASEAGASDISLSDLPGDEMLPYGGITLQTQVTRCLGSIRIWPWTLAKTLQSGYTMLHFTPVQKRGASGSAYSIWDQLTLDPELFRGDPEVLAAADEASARTLRRVLGLPHGSGVRTAMESAASKVVSDAARAGLSWGGEAGSAVGGSVAQLLLDDAPAGLRTRAVRRALSGVYDWLKHGEPRKIHWAEMRRRGDAGGMSPHAGASTRETADFDPDLDGEVEALKLRKLTEAVESVEREGRALSMVDIVLNHTATDSSWLGRHPEAAYSLTNSPALRSAAALDTELMRFSHEVAQGMYAGDGVHPKMGTADSVNAVVDLARETVPKRTRLWEYYVIDDGQEAAALLAWATGITPAGRITSRGRGRGNRPEALGQGVEGAVALAQSMQQVPYNAREDAVICDPLYGSDVQTTGRRMLGLIEDRTKGYGEWDFGLSLPAADVDAAVESLWSSGAVWNDGSGGRFAVHLAPDEASSEVQRRFGSLLSAEKPLIDVRSIRRAVGVAVGPESEQAASDADFASVARAISALRRVVAAINLRLYRAYDADVDKAFGAIRGTALHSWLGERSGRQSISLRFPLVYSYFARVGRTPVQGADGSATPAASGGGSLSFDRSAGSGACGARGDSFEAPTLETGVEGHCLACNGFIWGGESGIDFTLPEASIPDYVAVLNRRKTMRFRQRSWESRRGGSSSDAEEKSVEGGGEEGGRDESEDQARTTFKQPDVSELKLQSESTWDQHENGSDPGILRRIKTPTQSEMDELSGRAFGGAGGGTGRDVSHGAAGGHKSSESKDPFSLELRRFSSFTEEGAAPRDGDKEAGQEPAWSYPFPYAFSSASASQPVRAGESGGSSDSPGSDASIPRTPVGSRMSAPTRFRRVRIVSRGGQMLHLPPDLPVPIVNASTPYVRRSLVIWGDCVKLRYGRYPMDSPWLWAHMTEYAQRMASVFHAFRIDNCHGTPIHVAESILDAARAVRPDLYVNAELFTGSHEMDVAYISRLGINSLVQEAVQTDSPGAMVGKVAEGGGRPAGSLDDPSLPVRELLPSRVPGILFDCTHDNEAPTKLRTAKWALPTLAVTSMCAGACGSVRGFDDCVPVNPSVVEDHRLYARAPAVHELQASCDPSYHDSRLRSDVVRQLQAAAGSGQGALIRLPRCVGSAQAFLGQKAQPMALGLLRLAFTRLRLYLSRQGFEEVHVECHGSEVTPGTDVQVVHRGHPEKNITYVLVARQAWDRQAVGPDESGTEPLRFRMDGRLASVVLAGQCDVNEAPVRNEPPVGAHIPRRARVALASQVVAKATEGMSPPSGIQRSLAAHQSTASLLGWRHDAGVINGYEAPAKISIGTAFAGRIGVNIGSRAGKGELHAFFGVKHGDASESSGKEASCVGVAGSLGMVQRAELLEAGKGSSKGTSVTEVLLDRSVFSPGSVLLLRFDTAETPRLGCIDTGVDSGGTSSFSTGKEPASGAGGAGRLSEAPPLGVLFDCLVKSESVSLVDLCVLLYRAEPEEKDDSKGSRGCYGLPKSGLLPWAGAMGLLRPLAHVARWNDTGHPLCGNLRDGMWLAEYIVDRLRGREALHPAADWLQSWFNRVRGVEPGFRPQAFERVMRAFIGAALAAVFRRMRGSPLLALATEQGKQAMADLEVAGDAIGLAPGLAIDVDATTAFDRGNLLAAGSADKLTPSGGISGSSRGSETPDSLVMARMNADFFAAVGGTLDLGGAGRSSGSIRIPYDHALLLSSVMLFAEQPSAPLVDARLPMLPAAAGDSFEGCQGSLAAGVDHFCTGFMRSWGRDTFIALRGLLLVPGRWQEARSTILSFASVLRHGLIPNLMDGARNPRYNARDATWFWLQAVKDYCLMAPEGTRILAAGVRRRFPSDNLDGYFADGLTGGLLVPEGGWQPPVPLRDIVLECLSKHAGGIDFVEWNAGSRIDAHMKERGFRVTVKMCQETGLLLGGSSDNCGTWMDKMGEAPAHGTDGVPATPRDGAPAEISCLQYSVLSWLARLANEGDKDWGGAVAVSLQGGGSAGGVHSELPAWAAAEAKDEAVATVLQEPAWDKRVREASEKLHGELGSKAGPGQEGATTAACGGGGSSGDGGGCDLPLLAWAAQVLRSFERCYWVPCLRGSPSSDASNGGGLPVGQFCPDAECLCDPKVVNARGIYKDTYGGSAGWTDYQLRPNFVVGMAVAPELFTPWRARRALGTVERQLLGSAPGQVGVSTLCPSDWAYRPNYDNNDSSSRETAKGWNYHQGPEWVWPFGYYLRARLRFQPLSAGIKAGAEWAREDAVRWVRARQERHRQLVEESPHGGLPELTNEGGAPCPGSCVVQAWSSASLLDALLDARLSGGASD